MPSMLSSLLWFVAVLALIPLALWLLKRTPVGGGAAAGLMRTVGVLPLSPGQRLVTVELGQGEDRRWLVLGVTGQQITALHTMPPQAAAPVGPAAGAPFAQMLSRLSGRGAPGEDGRVG